MDHGRDKTGLCLKVARLPANSSQKKAKTREQAQAGQFSSTQLR